MKTYCKRWKIDESEVLAAIAEWRAHESGRANGWRVDEEYGGDDALAAQITAEVRARTLAFRPLVRRTRRDGTRGKVRQICVSSVKQQVCDYVVLAALAPLIEARTGRWQVAGIEGRGQRDAREAVSRWAREGGYHVHMDVRKCYESITTEAAMAYYARHTRSDDLTYMLGALFATYDGHLELGTVLSLRTCQLVLSEGYHHVEGLGRRRRGKWLPSVAHQLWYVDDVIMMGRDKRSLRSAARSLEAFMRAEFGLRYKAWKICRVGEDEPIDIAGFTVRPSRTTVRAAIFLRVRRAFLRFSARPRSLRLARRVCSYWGFLAATASRGFVSRTGVYSTFRRACACVARHERKGLVCP